mgnify:FL=1
MQHARPLLNVPTRPLEMHSMKSHFTHFRGVAGTLGTLGTLGTHKPHSTLKARTFPFPPPPVTRSLWPGVPPWRRTRTGGWPFRLSPVTDSAPSPEINFARSTRSGLGVVRGLNCLYPVTDTRAGSVLLSSRRLPLSLTRCAVASTRTTHLLWRDVMSDKNAKARQKEQNADRKFPSPETDPDQRLCSMS